MAKKSKSKDEKVSTKVVLSPKGGLLATFVHLDKPDDFGDEPKYTVTIIIPKKDKKTVKAVKDAIKAAMDKGIEDVFKKGKKASKLINPLKDGEDEDTEKYPYYEDAYVLKLSTKQKPKVIDLERNVITGDELYSGMFIYVSGAAYAYSTKGNDGVSFILGNVLKVEDGDKIGGGGFDVNDEFGDVLVGDDFEDDYEADDYEADDYEADPDEDGDELDFEDAEELIDEAKEIDGGAKAIKKILKKIGVKKVTDIDDEDDLDTFMDKLGDWVDDNE